jgi:hypothetical protein
VAAGILAMLVGGIWLIPGLIAAVGSAGSSGEAAGTPFDVTRDFDAGTYVVYQSYRDEGEVIGDGRVTNPISPSDVTVASTATGELVPARSSNAGILSDDADDIPDFEGMAEFTIPAVGQYRLVIDAANNSLFRIERSPLAFITEHLTPIIIAGVGLIAVLIGWLMLAASPRNTLPTNLMGAEQRASLLSTDGSNVTRR